MFIELFQMTSWSRENRPCAILVYSSRVQSTVAIMVLCVTRNALYAGGHDTDFRFNEYSEVVRGIP